MIGFLAGKVLEQMDGKLLVRVSMSADSSIGYQIQVPNHSRYAIPRGENVELYIHTHVREDALDLFGFMSFEEKDVFLTLLQVNGIGPKAGMGILSNVEIPTLLECIVMEDKDTLTKIPGIGKKTAERVVVELKDTIQKKLDQGFFPSFGRALNASTGSTGKKIQSQSTLPGGTLFRDAKEALLGLGYREQEIVSALKRIQESQKDSPAKSKSPGQTEEVIKLALKELM